MVLLKAILWKEDGAYLHSKLAECLLFVRFENEEDGERLFTYKRTLRFQPNFMSPFTAFPSTSKIKAMKIFGVTKAAFLDFLEAS